MEATVVDGVIYITLLHVCDQFAHSKMRLMMTTTMLTPPSHTRFVKHFITYVITVQPYDTNVKMGTYSGSLKWINVETGAEESVVPAHSSAITYVHQASVCEL